MWRGLDVLGALKWPSVLAVTLLPLWFYLTDWRHGYAGTGVVIYGPEMVAGMPLLLSHRADADPVRDPAVDWSARVCEACVARLKSLRLAHADCAAPPARWMQAEGPDGRLTARLETPNALREAQAPCVWVELQPIDSAAGTHRWQLVHIGAPQPRASDD